jgi:hypothetical protein
MQAIAAVFEESLTERHEQQSSLTPRSCKWHHALIDGTQRRDTIISFNYDCLADHTLRAHGGGKWNAHYGYGFKLGSHGTKLDGHDFWQPSKPATKNTTIKLLKLHGSLHFQVAEPSARVHLKERPYTQQHGNLHFTIIPPEWNKQFDKGIFLHLWQQAGAAIHRATTIVFIGYSLPSTDLHSTALFRTSVKRERLQSLVVVNPDPAARRRTREILHRGLNPTTKVLSFDTFREFAATNPELWKRF